MRAWNENSGPNPGAIAVVVENADWKAYAAYRSKLDERVFIDTGVDLRSA
jgi:hypothetical protein